MSFVETDQLSKSFGSFSALKNCSLQVEQGTIFGLLGPNGAGKSTLIRLLMGFMTPTSGRALINDLDCHQQSLAVRHITSYLPGDARLDRQYRGKKLLQLFAALPIILSWILAARSARCRPECVRNCLLPSHWQTMHR